jgi:hypothetical protein
MSVAKKKESNSIKELLKTLLIAGSIAIFF